MLSGRTSPMATPIIPMSPIPGRTGPQGPGWKEPTMVDHTHQHCIQPLTPLPGPGERGLLRRTVQRGMATAEYAVGILAAVALALVLLNIFNNNEFFSTMLKFVVGLIGKLGGMLP